jgi:hypothetical protein
MPAGVNQEEPPIEAQPPGYRTPQTRHTVRLACCPSLDGNYVLMDAEVCMTRRVPPPPPPPEDGAPPPPPPPPVNKSKALGHVNVRVYI